MQIQKRKQLREDGIGGRRGCVLWRYEYSYDEVTTAVISFLGLAEVKGNWWEDVDMQKWLPQLRDATSSDADTITKSILCHFTPLDPVV